MLLINVAKNTIESKFDGRFSIFKSGEKKRFLDKTEGAHILFKLTDYGLVEIPDTRQFEDAQLGDDVLKPYVITGLKSRRLTLNRVIQNFRTMNKEREAAKLSSETPSEDVIRHVKEINDIDSVLNDLQADDLAIVDKFLSDSDEQKTAKAIENSQVTLDKVGVSGYKISHGKPGRPKTK